ncbi:MAG: UvrD-helicase domain-containing protein [Paludibacteraceae bacterium]|nr:UvrD-helicase domain-containing protein [Paludibacteraceae bacterium]
MLSSLNKSQREAVEYIDGPSLVIAGAGSGKTRVITYKIAYLIQKGLPAYHILALTFTNKAAREMKERVAQLIDARSVRGLWIGTFHSVFSRILRAEAEKIGYTSSYTIYDADDAKRLVATIIKEKNLDDKKYKASYIASRISNAKNSLVTPSIYANKSDLLKADRYNGISQFYEVYQLYCRRCKEANAMDFDDLLLNMCVLLRDHEDVKQKYQDIFKYILVDEYQDTNMVQSYIVKQLTNEARRLCVVGDDAQSIYSFRGANIQNILRFQDDFSNCRVFKLEQNYRSTQNIVDAANSLIKKNRSQLFKNVYSENEKGAPLKVIENYSDRDEAETVSDEVARLHRNRHQYSEMVILYRTHAQSRVFEEAFLERKIPYRIYGGLSFYQRKEVKDVLAYLRLSVNPRDDESFKRIINFPKRNLGDTTVSKLVLYANEHNMPLLDVACNIADCDIDLNNPTKKRIFDFAQMMLRFKEEKEQKNAYEFAESLIREIGIMEALSVAKTTEEIDRKENVEELKSAIMEFCKRRTEETDDANVSVEDFLSEVSLLTDMDKTENDDNADFVTLMTIHASKCLEFKDVFIVGVEETLLPSCNDPEELEEERRLMYVAITRAKENCFISYAKKRFRNGQLNFSKPSRFISDIDEKYLDLPLSYKWDAEKESTFFNDSFRTGEYTGDSRYISEEKSLEPFKAARPRKMISMDNIQNAKPSGTHYKSADGLSVGTRIHHDRFGDGTILELEGEGDSRKMRVDFGDNQVRQLLLKFAKFTIL